MPMQFAAPLHNCNWSFLVFMGKIYLSCLVGDYATRDGQAQAQLLPHGEISQ